MTTPTITTEATRRCTKCGQIKPATTKFFVINKRGLSGLGNSCKLCYNQYQRQHRLSDSGREVLLRLRWSEKGRASALVATYRSRDRKLGFSCDLTIEWFLENIMVRPCSYCGDDQNPVGCDRLDNSLGHTMHNVVPCCTPCNIARNDNFTPEQMRLYIGPAIAAAKAHARAQAAA